MNRLFMPEPGPISLVFYTVKTSSLLAQNAKIGLVAKSSKKFSYPSRLIRVFRKLNSDCLWMCDRDLVFTLIVGLFFDLNNLNFPGVFNGFVNTKIWAPRRCHAI